MKNATNFVFKTLLFLVGRFKKLNGTELARGLSGGLPFTHTYVQTVQTNAYGRFRLDKCTLRLRDDCSEN